MENGLNSNECCICNSREFTNHISDQQLAPFTLIRCKQCEMVTATTTDGALSNHDYSDFGDYLFENELQNTDQYVASIQKKKKKFFNSIKQRYKNKIKLLDVGSGAGYFLMAADREGIEVEGVEISERLRSYSTLKSPHIHIYSSLPNVMNTYDVVTMFDVIEHISPESLNNNIASIYNSLKPGGLFIGNTPNINSINIKLHKAKDPAISPPLHLCYFSARTIHTLLTKHGFLKEIIISQGLSTNSFFRPKKDQYSFLEYPVNSRSIWERFFIAGIKLIFKSIGFLLRITPWGYNLHFQYRKPV